MYRVISGIMGVIEGIYRDRDREEMEKETE